MGSFEQSEPLTTRIGNIIKDYNASQVFQELLQNCDDARAPHVAFMLDKGCLGPDNNMAPLVAATEGQLGAHESTKSLKVQGEGAQWLMQQFCGPALYQYDSALFQKDVCGLQ